MCSSKNITMYPWQWVITSDRFLLISAALLGLFSLAVGGSSKNRGSKRFSLFPDRLLKLRGCTHAKSIATVEKKEYPSSCSLASTTTERNPFPWMKLRHTVLQPHTMHAVALWWCNLYRVKTGSQEATYHFLKTNQILPKSIPLQIVCCRLPGKWAGIFYSLFFDMHHPSICFLL